MTQSVPACHGIAIDPPSIGLELGWLSQSPYSRVRVDVVENVERATGAQKVWELEEPPGFGLPAITTQTWLEPEGSVWIGNTLNMALRIDYSDATVTVAPKEGNLQVLLEALASIALPLVAQKRGALILHAAAACHGDDAVLLCATGGSGKSSLLMGLVASGWQAVSEDQCVIDVHENGDHRVWPGPSWVRLKQGVPPTALVQGAEPRFEALDKVAWDLSSWMAHSPARVHRIVLLDPPGGDDLVWEPMSPDTVIGRLAQQSTWLQAEQSFAQSVLPQVVNLAMRVPGFRLRIPRQTDWLALGVATLTA